MVPPASGAGRTVDRDRISGTYSYDSRAAATAAASNTHTGAFRGSDSATNALQLRSLTKSPRLAAKSLSTEIRALSEAHLTESGRTVLGHFPGYVEKAQARGASYFVIGDAWKGLNEADRWAANRHFLDKIASSGDQVLLSTAKTKIRPGSSLAREVQYLTQEKGYRWVNQWSLRPR